jgi:predicted RNase H-like nuclease (RuvC/YqgF family)
MADNLSETKEKILFETNQLVISLNTQVAVLTNSNNTLKGTIETYMEKLDKQMERAEERDATLDQRVTILRNDVTVQQVKLDNVIDDVKELKSKSNLFDWINFIITAIVGALAYFFGNR